MKLTGDDAQRLVDQTNKATRDLHPPGCVNPRTHEPIPDDPERGIFHPGVTSLVSLDENGEFDTIAGCGYPEMAVTRSDKLTDDEKKWQANKLVECRMVDLGWVDRKGDADRGGAVEKERLAFVAEQVEEYRKRLQHA
ncbi:MAG TPA: hypothetical protein VHO25_22980, partial [Polyangiaceae bacterium]|nr:hypothetical protein [Polyangiaceae bacterium]